ncbi:hypothetical protein LEP1GSC170_3405 [Leptospira interrogans serovar Bataviae str. HAI135]|nr:hypothetical protein LEP1GSC170_3405 [Leptospira interrogans serovar Bataviae str. HAI135]
MELPPSPIKLAIFQFEEDELIFFGFSPLFKDDQIDWPQI